MSTPRILIVEDNPDDEALLMRQLRKAELAQHVKVIRNGSDALSYLKDPRNLAETLAAIFLDLNLPGLSGLKILEALRADERLSRLPVVVMTSSTSLRELEVCKKFGVSNFVNKPLTFSSFAKAFADTFHSPRPLSTGEISPVVGIETQGPSGGRISLLE